MNLVYTIHYDLHCKKCGSPMLFPKDTVEQPFADPKTRPNDSLCVGIVCHRCKSAETYFLHSKHPQWNPKDGASAREIRIEDTVLLSTLECEVEPCPSRLPLFAQWSPAANEAERLADMSAWKWGQLQCPEGHPIPKPNDWP